MVFDSEASKRASLVWVSDEGDRYSVRVEGILPSMGNGRLHPMPRVVDDDIQDPEKTTGFGMPIFEANDVLRCGRQAPVRLVYLLPWEDCPELPTEDVEAAMPICRPDGTVKNARSGLFSEENIQAVRGCRRSGRLRG